MGLGFRVCRNQTPKIAHAWSPTEYKQGNVRVLLGIAGYQDDKIPKNPVQVTYFPRRRCNSSCTDLICRASLSWSNPAPILLSMRCYHLRFALNWQTKQHAIQVGPTWNANHLKVSAEKDSKIKENVITYKMPMTRQLEHIQFRSDRLELHTNPRRT